MRRLRRENINTKGYWDGRADCDGYEEKAVESAEKRLSVLLEQVGPKSNILDIGCGVAPLLRKIRRTNLKILGYTGVDFSERFIKGNKKDYPNEKWVTASCCRLPFEKNSFNVVVMMEVLEHLDCPLVALSEIKRVLQGQLLLSVPNKSHIRHKEHVWTFESTDIAILLSLLGFYDIENMLINNRKIIFSKSKIK